MTNQPVPLISEQTIETLLTSLNKLHDAIDDAGKQWLNILDEANGNTNVLAALAENIGHLLNDNNIAEESKRDAVVNLYFDTRDHTAIWNVVLKDTDYTEWFETSGMGGLAYAPFEQQVMRIDYLTTNKRAPELLKIFEASNYDENILAKFDEKINEIDKNSRPEALQLMCEISAAMDHPYVLATVITRLHYFSDKYSNEGKRQDIWNAALKKSNGDPHLLQELVENVFTAFPFGAGVDKLNEVFVLSNGNQNILDAIRKQVADETHQAIDEVQAIERSLGGIRKMIDGTPEFTPNLTPLRRKYLRGVIDTIQEGVGLLKEAFPNGSNSPRP